MRYWRQEARWCRVVGARVVVVGGQTAWAQLVGHDGPGHCRYQARTPGLPSVVVGSWTAWALLTRHSGLGCCSCWAWYHWYSFCVAREHVDAELGGMLTGLQWTVVACVGPLDLWRSVLWSMLTRLLSWSLHAVELGTCGRPCLALKSVQTWGLWACSRSTSRPVIACVWPGTCGCLLARC